MSNPLSKIASAIETVILSRVENNKIFDQYYKRTDSRIPYTRESVMYMTKVINDWKLAVMAATDPYYPCRGQLMRFYQSLKLDNHLSSVMDSRIMRVQRSSYKIVNVNGEENEQLKELLERPWFDDLIRLVIGKVFQGTTLIELFDLDENGELLHVNEIPQSNFIPQLGVITNFEGQFDGTSYKEGIYADYYLQVGGDWELGMLNELAMVILAKKLGLGSWMSYIDKFGVPPVFVTTDRMDKKRTDELFDMLTNFRSNQFTVLQGNEKVEIPNNYASDGHQSFKALNEFCDEQISKRVLGNTASTDKKAFVGAAEVQERVSQDRYESDKLLFKYFFNTQIRQRLAKLSTVYADFATHTIIFDNQETICINDYIKGVTDLAQYFDFDTEKIALRTGLPITGTKPVPVPNKGTPAASISQKKKINANLNLAPFARTIIYASTWNKNAQSLATNIYNGKVKPSDLDKEMVISHYNSFNDSASEAWGKDFSKAEIAGKIQDNLMMFSGAKTYNLMSHLNDLTGKGLDNEQFMTEAQKVVFLHNNIYLGVEKNFVASCANSARDWQQFVKDTDIYPNLMFKTMEDAEVREEHAALDGMVKPVDDPDWDIYTPPLGFNCRCWLEQTMDDATDSTPKVTIPEQFQNNTGKTGEVFTDEHSYFKSIPEDDKDLVTENTDKIKESMNK
jgi:SPP1 gp7 family putative phage head morphogenesis protein